MRERMVRKRDLEIAISKISPHPKPKIYLEQYTIPPEVATEILFIAAYIFDDVVGKKVVDLGCGTGRLAIGSALLGAGEVFGFDIDSAAVKIAQKNATAAGVNEKVQWVISDIDAITGRCDTVIMNPPFGTRVKHMDKLFLSKAMAIAKVVYSLHKRSTRQYILRFIDSKNGSVETLFQMRLEIPRIFDFHRRKRYAVDVDLYRILVGR